MAALDGKEWSPSLCNRITPRTEPWYPLDNRLMRPGYPHVVARNTLSLLGTEPSCPHRIRSLYDWAIRVLVYRFSLYNYRSFSAKTLLQFNLILNLFTCLLSSQRPIIIIIESNSYLFAFQINSPRANYKVSTSERKETNIHKVQNKAK
jgi:hypothetical protein